MEIDKLSERFNYIEKILRLEFIRIRNVVDFAGDNPTLDNPNDNKNYIHFCCYDNWNPEDEPIKVFTSSKN